jgi:hypothetical protein
MGISAVAFATFSLIVSAAGEDTIEGQVFIRTEGGETLKLSLVDVLLFDQKVMTDDLEKKRKAAVPIGEYLLPLERRADDAYKTADEACDRMLIASLRAENANHIASTAKTCEDADFNSSKALLDIATAAGVSWPARVYRAPTPLTDDKGGLIRTQDAHDYEQRVLAAHDDIHSEWSTAYFGIRGKVDYLHSALYYFSDLPRPLNITKTDADGKFTFAVPSGFYVLVAASSRKVGETGEDYRWMVMVAIDADKKVMLANDNLSSSGSPNSLILTPKSEGYIAEAMKDGNIRSLTALVESKKSEQAIAEAATRERERLAHLEPFRRGPALAQRNAVELYPDLAVSGSSLNKEFVARLKRYKTENPKFFAEPDWPMRLAKECDDELKTKEPRK